MSTSRIGDFALAFGGFTGSMMWAKASHVAYLRQFDPLKLEPLG
jgi:hypothetical protein